MTTTKTRKMIAALAATAALAVVGPAAAQAATHSATTSGTATTSGADSTSTGTASTWSTTSSPTYSYDDSGVARTDGGATGDGPADDEICQAWADYYDGMVASAGGLYDAGLHEDAQQRYEDAENVKNYGMSQGCFFID